MISRSNRWHHFFVLAGAIGLLWFFLWALLVSNSPDTHRRISEIEKTYIKASLIKEVNIIFTTSFLYMHHE